MKALVVRLGARDVRHRRRRVDTDELGCARAPSSQLPEQVAGSAPDIQHVARHCPAFEGEPDAATRELVMKPAEPAFIVSSRTFGEGGDITVSRQGIGRSFIV
jgi:hypothetical protein